MQLKKRKVIAVLAFSLSLIMMAGCGGNSAPAQSASAPAAQETPAQPAPEAPAAAESTGSAVIPTDRKDLSLTVYWGAMEDLMALDLAEFTKATGIKAEGVRMSSGEILGRVRAEAQNPQASIWYGGPADGHIQANAEGLLTPYISPNAANIPDMYKDPNGAWTGVYVGYLGFASNQVLLDEMGAEAPTSWYDLLKPEFKGQVSIASPASSGTAYTMLATIVQLMGEEAGLQYMVDLDKNIKIYEKSGTAPARLAGQGEATIGVTFMHDTIKYKEEGLKDLVTTAPIEGTGYEIGGLSIIKGGPDEEAAKIFVDWALTKEAQELAQTVGSYQFLTNPDAVPPAIVDEIRDTKLIDYDLNWAGSVRSELVEKWNAAVGAQ